MKDSSKFWIIFISTVIIALVLHCQGCDGSYPDHPKVARRHFDTMLIGSVRTPPDPGYANDRPDDGKEGNPNLRFWAKFMMSEEGVEIGGVRFDIETVFYDGERRVSKIYSNNAGYGVWDVKITSPTGSYQRDFSTTASGPRCGKVIGGTFQRYTGGLPSIGYYIWNRTQMGEYWACASQIGDGYYICSGMASPLASSEITTSLCSSESDFLNRDPNQFSESLVQWTGIWYRTTKDGYIPTTWIQPCDTTNEDVIKHNATRYFVSYQFYTMEPTELSGSVFHAKMKVSMCEPNVIDPNNFADISIRVVADSTDGRSHIAHSDYIVAVDPNGFVPYYIIDDAGNDILVCPVFEGNEFDIEIIDRAQFINYVTPKWLTSCAPLDINDDGIVNYKDLKGF